MATTWVIPTGAAGSTGTTTSEGGASALAVSGGATQTLQSAMAYPGMPVGIQFLTVASTQNSTQWTLTGGPTATCAFRFSVVTPSVTPNLDETIATIRHASGVIMRVIHTVTGVLAVSAITGGTIAVSTAVTLNTKYDISMLLAQDASAGTTGSYTVKVYLAGTNTQVGSGLTVTGTANLGLNAISGFAAGALSAETAVHTVGLSLAGYEIGRVTEIPFYATAANVIPTVASDGVVTIGQGVTTATITGFGDDTDGTISTFTCAYRPGTGLNVSTMATTPTIGPVTVTSGAGTAHATFSFAVSGLTDGRAFFDIIAVDNLGGQSVAGTARINKTELSPIRTGTTLVSITKITPSTGTNSAALNNQANVAVLFETLSPPAAGSLFQEAFQPIDLSGDITFGQMWNIKNDATTIVPTTVWVDLKEGGINGTVRATATASINSYTPTFVGRTTTPAETASITDRSNLAVVGRFA